MFLNDIDIASYADDNTPYIVSNKPYKVIESLEIASDKLLSWFSNNGNESEY